MAFPPHVPLQSFVPSRPQSRYTQPFTLFHEWAPGLLSSQTYVCIFVYPSIKCRVQVQLGGRAPGVNMQTLGSILSTETATLVIMPTAVHLRLAPLAWPLCFIWPRKTWLPSEIIPYPVSLKPTENVIVRSKMSL